MAPSRNSLWPAARENLNVTDFHELQRYPARSTSQRRQFAQKRGLPALFVSGKGRAPARRFLSRSRDNLKMGLDFQKTLYYNEVETNRQICFQEEWIPMNRNIDRFLPLTRFIAELLGPDSEVILYEAESRTVYHVINPFDDQMAVGSEMRSLECSFLDNRLYEREDFIVNYRAISMQKGKLKSATIFLRSDDRKLVGVLTVNVNVDRLVEMRDILNIMISGYHPYDQKSASFYNSFDVSVEGMVVNTIKDELAKYNVEPTRLSQKEKLEVVSNLDQKGIFLVKGAIAELAGFLHTTETTIYRYLNKLSAMKGKP